MKPLMDYPARLVSKGYSRLLMEHCSSCGMPRIDAVMDSIGRRKPLCVKCAAAKSAILPTLTETLAHRDAVMDFVSHPLYRRTLKAIVAGISFFGPSAPQTTGWPSHITWNVTRRCNLHCLHCYADAGDGGKEITTKGVMRIADMLAVSGVASLALSGGEPLLRKDTLRIARRASDQGIYVSLETNGTLVDKKMAKRISSSGIKAVDIALDGGVPKTHDIFRQSPGCFRQTTEGIANCTDLIKSGTLDDVSVTMTLTERNWSEVAIAYEHATKLQCTSFYVTPLLPAGRGRELRSPVTVPQRVEVMRFMQMQLRERMKDGMKGRTRPLPLARNMPYYSRFAQDAGTDVPDGRMYFALRSIRHGDARLEGSAWSAACMLSRVSSSSAEGVASMAISENGEAMPSASSSPIGSAMAMRTLWLSDRTLKAMRARALLKGKCGACADRNGCGGSRTNAFASSYDWLEADPGCPY